MTRQDKGKLLTVPPGWGSRMSRGPESTGPPSWERSQPFGKGVRLGSAWASHILTYSQPHCRNSQHRKICSPKCHCLINGLTSVFLRRHSVPPSIEKHDPLGKSTRTARTPSRTYLQSHCALFQRLPWKQKEIFGTISPALLFVR